MEQQKQNTPVLVVMAAGMGSRFGGLKQITPVDEAGHTLMEYAIYDAFRGGFRDVLFIIRGSFEDEFREKIGNRVADRMNVSYVRQELDMLPEGCELPEGREKPWGTTHALFCCREALDGRPFLTVNADDYYGVESFRIAYNYLAEENADEDCHGIIGYEAVKTLSEKGTVSRGICKTDEDGALLRIDERKVIKLENGLGYFTLDHGETWEAIPQDAKASMNMWAFRAGFLKDQSVSFPDRLRRGIAENPIKFEETLSDAVQDMMDRGKARAVVLPTPSTWFGMTYKEDMDAVIRDLAELTEKGVYPQGEW
ncbi:MAG: nucleotidyltransferase [Eubacterium sp.]|nr:nucleotidyltransferase [Eubacterium sp.]